MKRLSIASVLAVALSLVSLACGPQEDAPTAPALTPSASSATGSSGAAGRASSASPTAAHLEAVTGIGSGTVKVTPTGNLEGGFSAQIAVNVHGAPPNTIFYIQRAPEVGRANGADGICQRGAGLPPWGPPAPNFVTFPLPGTGPLATLETSEGGAGSAHIDFVAAGIADGTSFDVMFRLVDSLTNPTNDLRSSCFTVTAK